MKYLLFVSLILVMVIISNGHVPINYIHEWKCVEYNSTNNHQKQINDAIESKYNMSKCMMFDAAKANDGTLFVTIPQEFCPYSPATLATVSNEQGKCGPLLNPYPDWSWYNSIYTCDNIVNVHRVDIKCNHLFVMDNGKVGTDQICNPKLLIFNLENDELRKIIYIPLDVALNQMGVGLLTEPLVYVLGRCSRVLDNAVVFIADMEGYGLVVHDWSTNHMCRVESDYMKPTDIYYSIANENFTFVSGIIGLTIMKNKRNIELFYNPASGKKVYKIKVQELLKCPNKKVANKRMKLAFEMKSQVGQIASIDDNYIIYGPSHDMSIEGMNLENSCKVTLAKDKDRLQGISALKVSPSEKELTCLLNKFQRFAYNTLNPKEINFCYFEIPVENVKNEMNNTCFSNKVDVR